MSALPGILAPLLLGLLFAAPFEGADSPPKLGLALSGGGARGIAHIGVLKALEEKDIHVDYIAGTSTGAVVGSLYASGYSADRLLEIVGAIDWQNIFSDEPERRLVPLERRLQEVPPVVRVAYGLWSIKPPTSVLSDYGIQQMLSRYLTEPNLRAGRDFDKLPIPFRPVAADLRSGERVILTEGCLARAVRASMSIPLAFSPVPWEGRLLVDGGIADNVPVGAVRDMGAEAVIAIDISSPPEDLSAPSVFGIVNQLTELLITARNAAIREDPEIYVRPELGRHSFMDYSNFEFLVEQGYQAAMDQMEEIERLVGGGRRGDGRARGTDVEDSGSRRIIAEIAVEGNEYFEDELIQREFGIHRGTRLDMDAVLAGLDKSFAVGFFETAWIEAVPLDDEHVRLVLHMEEAEHRVADIGVSYNEDDEAAAFVRLNNRNLLGWGEHEQFAVDASDRTKGFRLRMLRPGLFLSPMGLEMRAEFREDNPRFVQDGAFVNRAEFDRRVFSVGAHLPLGRFTLLRFGFQLENVVTEETAGLDFGPTRNDLQLLYLSVNADNLDDFYRPTRGTAFSVTLERNVHTGGMLDTYWRGLARGRLALPLHERGVVEGSGLLGLAEGGLPISEQFRIGGPVLVPGLRREALWGNQAFGLSAGYRFLVSSNLSLIGRVSSGNVWEETSDIDFESLRFGGAFGLQYETPVGPIKLDFGVNENGSTRIYFSAGFF